MGSGRTERVEMDLAERERLFREGEFRGNSVSKPLPIAHRVKRCCMFILHEINTGFKEVEAVIPSQSTCSLDNGMATI